MRFTCPKRVHLPETCDENLGNEPRIPPLPTGAGRTGEALWHIPRPYNGRAYQRPPTLGDEAHPSTIPINFFQFHCSRDVLTIATIVCGSRVDEARGDKDHLSLRIPPPPPSLPFDIPTLKTPDDLLARFVKHRRCCRAQHGSTTPRRPGKQREG